jgi:monoamine oxidase
MVDVDLCVVDLAFAGLTAALRLIRKGHSVMVLEARDRIGGRTFTEVRARAVHRPRRYLDRPRPGRDLRVDDGVRHPGVRTIHRRPAMMFVDGKKDRYGGTIPWTMSPWASANVGIAFLRLGAECARPFRPRLL